MKVQDVCAAETGSFVGVVVGGAGAGAALTAFTVGGLCLALGVPTAGAGTLVCAIVVVGVGSFAGGAIGRLFGEGTAEILYEENDVTVSLADRTYMVLGLLDLGGLSIWMGVSLHLAYTKMDLMLEHLKNCSAIRARAPLRQGGPWGKLLLAGGISGIVTFPGFYLKQGAMSVEDLRNFPPGLKRKLAVLHHAVLGLLALMCIMGVVTLLRRG